MAAMLVLPFHYPWTLPIHARKEATDLKDQLDHVSDVLLANIGQKRVVSVFAAMEMAPNGNVTEFTLQLGGALTAKDRKTTFDFSSLDTAHASALSAAHEVWADHVIERRFAQGRELAALTEDQLDMLIDRIEPAGAPLNHEIERHLFLLPRMAWMERNLRLEHPSKHTLLDAVRVAAPLRDMLDKEVAQALTWAQTESVRALDLSVWPQADQLGHDEKVVIAYRQTRWEEACRADRSVSGLDTKTTLLASGSPPT